MTGLMDDTSDSEGLVRATREDNTPIEAWRVIIHDTSSSGFGRSWLVPFEGGRSVF